jgi:hypothetical protein
MTSEMAVTLRVTGHDFSPEKVTPLLGCHPQTRGGSEIRCRIPSSKESTTGESLPSLGRQR